MIRGIIMNDDISDNVIKDVEKYLKFNLDKVDRILSIDRSKPNYNDVLMRLRDRVYNDNMSLWKKEGEGHIACGSIREKKYYYITKGNEIKASDFIEIAHDSSGEYIRAKPRDEWLSTIAAIVKHLTVIYLKSIRDGFEIDLGSSLNHLLKNRTHKKTMIVSDTEHDHDDHIFITKKEASKMLRVSVSTIDNYRRRGVIKSYKSQGSRVVLFKKEELISLVKEI